MPNDDALITAAAALETASRHFANCLSNLRNYGSDMIENIDEVDESMKILGRRLQDYQWARECYINQWMEEVNNNG